MHIEEFWVVTKSTHRHDELCDVMQLTTPYDLGLRIAGGLRRDEILLMTTDHREALDLAVSILPIRCACGRRVVPDNTNCIGIMGDGAQGNIELYNCECGSTVSRKI